MSYDPHRYTGLLQSGFDRLGDIGQKGYQHFQQEKQLDKPLPPDLQKYIARILKGEDPQKVGLEARNDPNLAHLIDSRLRNQPQPSPQSMVPDVGMRGGQPAVMQPGAVSPSGAQNPYAQQAPLSLGSINSQQHAAAQGAIGGAQVGSINPQSLGAMDVQMRGQTVSGVPGQDALALMGQPMQGAPQVQADTRPSVASFMPQQPAQPQAQPGSQQGGQYTYRDLKAISPLIPTIEASRSREAVAKTAADAKRETEMAKNERIVLVQVMRENGLNERAISDFLIKTEGLDVKQQQAVLNAMIGMYKADRSAEAAVGSARIRSDRPTGGEDPDEKELRALGNNLATITADPYWQSDDKKQAQVAEITRKMNALGARLGKPWAQGGVEKPKPAPAKTAPATGQPVRQTSGKVRVRNKQTGQVGTITPPFDPAKYEKLD